MIKQIDKKEKEPIIQKNKNCDSKTINSNAFDPEKFLLLIDKNYYS